MQDTPTIKIPEGFVEHTHETGIKHILPKDGHFPFEVPEGFMGVALANGDRLVVPNNWEPAPVKAIPAKPVNNFTMSFGLAIDHIKAGSSVTRKEWNSEEMFLFLIQGSNDIAKLHGYGFGEYLHEPTFQDAIFMKTPGNKLVPWVPSQTDILSNDWGVLD